MESHPKLIVIMHDFEQFDSSVVQDLFYICRYLLVCFFPAF
jgi:origin recognition complex subunit 3